MCDMSLRAAMPASVYLAIEVCAQESYMKGGQYRYGVTDAGLGCQEGRHGTRVRRWGKAEERNDLVSINFCITMKLHRKSLLTRYLADRRANYDPAANQVGASARKSCVVLLGTRCSCSPGCMGLLHRGPVFGLFSGRCVTTISSEPART